MTDKSFQTDDIDNYSLSGRLSRIESDIQLLDYRLKKEIPPDLSDRIIILEQKFDSEINVLKKELSEAKGTMKERLTFISIIVGLIIALASLIIGRI